MFGILFCVASKININDEMQNEINGVNSAILEANQSLIEFNNSIRELDWEIFDYLQESVSSITDESDFLLDLLGNEKAFDELGKNTQFADARYGLMGINYNTYMEQANQYADALKELDEQFANDPLNMDYLERRNELLESQRDAIKNAEDEKQAIIDLIEEGYNAQLKALDELIQRRKDALDEEKSLYDFNKKIQEQTQNIANLRKQYQAFSTDDSGENQQTLQDLRNQLKDAEEELEETQYDKYLEDQSALLDTLYSSFEEWISIRLDNTDRLISETIAAVNDNSNNIANTINTATSDVGYTVTNSMKEILNTSTGSITDMISNYDSNFSNKMTTLQSAIDNIKANVAQMVANANAEAAAQQAQQQQQQANQGSNYGTGGKSPTNSGSSSSSSSSSSSNSSSSSGGFAVGDFFIYKKDYFNKNRLNVNTSIVDRLKFHDFDSSWAAREKYYHAMGFSGNYVSSGSQNVSMITWIIYITFCPV